jgi:hypothetical protein
MPKTTKAKIWPLRTLGVKGPSHYKSAVIISVINSHLVSDRSKNDVFLPWYTIRISNLSLTELVRTPSLFATLYVALFVSRFSHQLCVVALVLATIFLCPRQLLVMAKRKSALKDKMDRARRALADKLLEEVLAEFDEDNFERLGRNGYTSVYALSIATEKHLEGVLNGQLGLVTLILKAFGAPQLPSSKLYSCATSFENFVISRLFC